MRWTRRRTYAVVGVFAVSGLALAVLPAMGDSHPDAVRLHLGTDGQYFEYETTRQDLTTTRCEVNELTGPVMALDANRKVGMDSFGIGVKSGGAQGVPCGRVDTSETLELSVPGSGELAGRFFDGLRLDLELKGNARVIATLHDGSESRTFELGSGSSIETGDVPAETDDDGVFRATSTKDNPNVACGAQSDSGPDAGARDNCLWTIDPGFDFNRIVLTAEVGEFSLEGSADYGNDPAFDSVFFVANTAPVANDDTATTDEDTPISVDVVANDTDADASDTLTVVAFDTPAKGTASESNGVITYDPAGEFESLGAGETDAVTFSYTISDGTDTDTATVTVTINGVNDAPTANDDEALINVATETSIDIDVLANDTDPDAGDTLTVTTFDMTTAENGTVVQAVDGSLTYTPPAGFAGSDTFSYTVEDSGGLTDTATVTVHETLDCGETLSLSQLGVDASYERLPTNPCPPRAYDLDIVQTTSHSVSPTVVFQPSTDDPVADCSNPQPGDVCDGEFKGTLAFTPAAKANPPDTGTLQYDPVFRSNPEEAQFRDMQWCEFDPFGTLDPGDSDRDEMRDALPAGESWCIVSVETVIHSATETRTWWTVYGIGDPLKRLS